MDFQPTTSSVENITDVHSKSSETFCPFPNVTAYNFMNKFIFFKYHKSEKFNMTALRKYIYIYIFIF